MGLIFGLLTWLAGMALFIVSLRVLSRANPGHKIPFVGHPPRNPGKYLVLLALAMGLLIFSSIASSDVLGSWSSGLTFLVLIPSFFVIRRHNLELQT